MGIEKTRGWKRNVGTGALGLGLTGLVAVVGCNAVLDNQSGQLAESDASVTTEASTGSLANDAGQDSSRIDAGSPFDSGGGLDKPDTGVGGLDASDASPGITCAQGQKLCDGTCVSLGDPLYGCTDTSCTPCALDRASAVCAGGACAIGHCNPGYADCNQTGSDGCETDLSSPSHCGACNATCGAAAPNCAPSGAGFSCTTGCTASAPTLCGNTCVDLLSSENHCGSCSHACAPVDNGTTKCTLGFCAFDCGANFHACSGACASNTSIASCGTSCDPCVPPANAQPTCDGASCGFVCNAGFHACGSTCAPDNSIASCGTSCGPCATGPNATATCTGGTCGIACAAGTADCNTNAADGCEIDVTTDPAHCGDCTTSCGEYGCNAGKCALPPVDAGLPDTGLIDSGLPLKDAAPTD